jgi:hypothetical protein
MKKCRGCFQHIGTNGGGGGCNIFRCNCQGKLFMLTTFQNRDSKLGPGSTG